MTRISSDAIKGKVDTAWRYFDPGEKTCWKCVSKDGSWKAVIAPVFQKVVGEDDGNQIWARCCFDLQKFGDQNGVRVDYSEAVTHIKGNPLPRIDISGDFDGEPFELAVFLQPLPGSAAYELVDRQTNEVTPIEIVEADVRYEDDREPIPSIRFHCDLHNSDEYRLPTVRDALCKNICLSRECENGWHSLLVEDFEAIFGDDLLPGLIECLEDADPELRYRAVQLLHEGSSKRPDALPLLIKSLEDGEASVRHYMLHHIHEFGSAAAAALPILETLLNDSNEYMRLLAAVDVLSLDPGRTELLPVIYEALESDATYVQDLAREMLAKWKMRLPFNEAVFEELVRRHWRYMMPSNRTYWRCTNEDGAWKAVIAPVFQEVYGGRDDGAVTWGNSEYPLSFFGDEHGIEIKESRAMSQGGQEELPVIEISGTYFTVPFALEIHLQPISESAVSELVDLRQNRVKEIGNGVLNDWERFRYYYSCGTDDEDEVDQESDEGDEWKRGIHPD